MKTFLSAFVVILLLAVQPIGAVSILQMDLADLSDRADKIFRGKVVDFETSTVQVGGSELPIVVYTMAVEEALKGSFDGKGVVEIRMFGSKEGLVPVSGTISKFPLLSGQPAMQVGEDYLLFTTQPSTIGLSTTVGLGHGCFHISEVEKQEMAVNEYDNAGVFDSLSGLPASGPVLYSSLVQEINNTLAQ